MYSPSLTSTHFLYRLFFFYINFFNLIYCYYIFRRLCLKCWSTDATSLIKGDRRAPNISWLWQYEWKDCLTCVYVSMITLDLRGEYSTMGVRTCRSPFINCYTNRECKYQDRHARLWFKWVYPNCHWTIVRIYPDQFLIFIVCIDTFFILFILIFGP